VSTWPHAIVCSEIPSSYRAVSKMELGMREISTGLTNTARDMVSVPQIGNARVFGDRGGHG